MTRLRLAWPCATCILLWLAVAGCVPGADSRGDEQKEPHYLMGQKLAAQLDYQGAVDAYEKALQVNPRSASAHFELALLCEDKDKAGDPAAAIYHFQRFLKLCSRSDNRIDAVGQHIISCKVELAKGVAALAPLSPSAQNNLEKILLENRDLKAQLVKMQEEYSAAHLQMPTNLPSRDLPPNPPPPRTAREISASAENSHAASASLPLPPANRTPVPATARTHTIKSGETLAAIARQHGISLAALQAANPRAEPTRLHVGATLNIPTL